MSSTTAPEGVQQLLDAQEIQRLLFDYAFHLDMNHPDEIAALFIENCVVVYGPGFGAEGRDAYQETLQGIGTFFHATSHHVTNIVIDFTGEDEARVRSILYAWHRYVRDRPDGHMWGQYHDVVVRVNGRWMFARRELRAAGTKDFHVKDNLPIGRA